MLAVISPAKKLNFDLLPEDFPESFPDFQKEANSLAATARQLSQTGLRQLMGISADLAKLNQARFKAFEKQSDVRNSKQAALAFAGDTYVGLQADGFSSDDLTFAQEHLRILSGLYGVLRPLDRIQPYRLEMGSRLKTRRGTNLYAYWGDQLGKVLDQAADGGPVINLASTEYFKATGKKMASTVITPSFKEDSGVELKMIGFFAKKARGMMARYMVENRITDAEALKAFDLEGYGFRPDLSDATNWTFTRKAA
jgi:cytoplasmic iron level regulating protein YaaA (DUF328/UPF0246 family)